MKILYIITELTPAGAEHIVADLAGDMIRCGHQVCAVSLLARPQETAVVDRLSSCGAEIRYLDATKTSMISVLLRLRRVIREFGPDLVHAHLIHPNLLSRLALAGTRIPLVNTIHIAEHRSGKGVFFLLDRLTLRRCAAMTAVSQAAADYHAARCGIPSERIRVIANGIDEVTPAPKDECSALLADCGLAGCTKIIGSVGRLDWQKGYDRLLRAVPKLAGCVPAGETWGILILGEGSARAELARIAAEVACPNIRIALPGFRANAASLMASFDVFVMPSRYEGYGLVLAEAMSLGLPCVVSDADSLPELARDYPGFVRVLHFSDAAGPDADALAAAFAEAIPAQRAESYRHFSREAMLAAYHNLYCELTERT